MKKARGFTVTELVTVGAIVTVAAAMASPTVVKTVRSERLSTGAQGIAQALQSARYDAMRTNERTKVEFDTTRKTYTVYVRRSGDYVAKETRTLSSDVSFADLPEGVTPPTVISTAVSKASSIDGQQSNANKKISFSLSSDVYSAYFTAKGLPGKSSGDQVEPGQVNWFYLTNDQGELYVITLTSEGEVIPWRWNAGTSQWVK